MNILMYSPEIPKDSYWSLHHALKITGKRSLLPPLALMTVAAMLPEHNIDLVDENIEPLRQDHLDWADIMFISAAEMQAGSLEATLQRTDIPTVVGGPYAAQYYDRIHADHLIIGEAESGILRQFMRDFERGQAKRAYANITLRRHPEGRKIDEENAEEIARFFDNDIFMEGPGRGPTMDGSPIPRFDLVRTSQYGSMPMQFSRACPHNCEFCSEGALYGDTPRLKDPEQIIAEFEAVRTTDYRGSIFFVDDNLYVSRKAGKSLIEHVAAYQQRHNYPFSFMTQGDIHLAQDPELMELMRMAGFDALFVGIESPSAAALERAGKRVNLGSNLIDAVHEIQRYGIEVSAGFIMGMDDEPDDIGDAIFDFIQEAGIPTAMAGLLIPAKGSLLHARYKRERRLLERNAPTSNTHNFQLYHTPDRGRDPKDIIGSNRRLLDRLYDASGENYFERGMRHLEHLGPRVAPPQLRHHDIATIARSLAVQNRQSYSPAYRRFLAEAIRHHPRKMRDAVRTAVLGHHYITITQALA